MIDIRNGDFEDPQVLNLLRAHLAGMHENSPPGSVYALDLSGLKAPGVSFYAGWDGAALVVMGALKTIDAETAEIKSMRTHTDHLRRGFAALMLTHLVSEAKARGHRRVSLETGSGAAFEPAITLYRRYGFIAGAAFGDYEKSDFNQFFHLEI